MCTCTRGGKVRSGTPVQAGAASVAEIVLVEDCAGTQGEQLIQGELLPGPPPVLHILGPGATAEPREFAVPGHRGGGRIAGYKPVQVRVLPVEGCLQDVMCLIAR